MTLAGATQVQRAYYHCAHCHRGQSPGDRRQGLSPRQGTAGVKRLVANFAGCRSYAETVQLLELSTGLRGEAFSAEQIVAEVGQPLRARAAQAPAAVRAGEGPAAATRRRRRAPNPLASGPTVPPPSAAWSRRSKRW